MITVIGSLKGGTGKSTLAFNLAIWLTRADMAVKAIDLDPQATFRDVAAVRQDEGLEPLVGVQNGASLDEPLNEFDGEVLIDVGLADFESLKRAIAMADRVVVPVPPSQADIWSTQTFVDLVHQAGRGTDIPQILCFINRADTHHAVRDTNEAAAALVGLPGIKFIKRRLGQRMAYRRSFSEGMAVFELEPRGKAASELTALAASLYPNALS